jgi:hypothetical protein
VRTPVKVLRCASLPLGGAAAGYIYLVGILRPKRPAVACLLVRLHDLRCVSYQLIVSTPFFLIVGALIGTWLAYALMLYTAPSRRGFAYREAVVVAPLLLGITAWIIAVHPGLTWDGWDPLGWVKILLVLVAAVLVRLAIGIASFANVRGGLILAFGLPVICAGLGYAFIRVFQQPPVGHSCPTGAGSACVYHPLIGMSGPWILLGLLAGLWLTYAAAPGLAGSPRRGVSWAESVIVLPVMTTVILWAVVTGPDQAGGGYVGQFVLLACLAALLRFLLSVGTVRNGISRMLTKLGMVSRTGAAAQS